MAKALFGAEARMTKSKILIAVSLGLLTGVGVGSIVLVSVLWAYTAVGLGVLGLVFAQYVAPSSDQSADDAPQYTSRLLIRNPRFATLAALWFVLGTGFGFLRIQTALATPSEFAAWVGQKQDFEGVVVVEPDVRQDKQLISVQPDGYTQRVLVTTTLASFFQYGDRVWVRGKVVEAESFDDFDYPGYLARFNTFALARYPKILTLRTGEGNYAIRQLLHLKAFLVQRLRRAYDETTGNLLLGILIGAKRGLPQTVTDNFVRTGTSHLLAVSGFNISIFITGLAYVAYIIGRRWQVALSVLLILAYVVIAGPSASVLRAASMGFIVMLALTSGRLYNSLPALVFVAAAMVALNPRILYWDIGFQLSAAATAGIVVGMPLLDICRKKLGDAYKPLAILGVTVAAILATLPISLWHFGQLSVVAPLVNFLVVPPIPLVMALGALSFVPVLGVGFAWINNWLLTLLLWVVEYFSKPAWVIVGWRISGPEVLLGYAILIAAYVLLRSVVRRLQRAA